MINTVCGRPRLGSSAPCVCVRCCRQAEWTGLDERRLGLFQAAPDPDPRRSNAGHMALLYGEPAAPPPLGLAGESAAILHSWAIETGHAIEVHPDTRETHAQWYARTHVRAQRQRQQREKDRRGAAARGIWPRHNSENRQEQQEQQGQQGQQEQKGAQELTIEAGLNGAWQGGTGGGGGSTGEWGMAGALTAYEQRQLNAALGLTPQPQKAWH